MDTNMDTKKDASKKMKKPIEMVGVQLAEPVDKALWDQTLDMVARLIIEECLERERLKLAPDKPLV